MNIKTITAMRDKLASARNDLNIAIEFLDCLVTNPTDKNTTMLLGQACAALEPIRVDVSKAEATLCDIHRGNLKK